MTGVKRDVAAIVREVAAGGASDEVEVVRRAGRGEDELLLLSTSGSWWVSRRVDGVVRVIAYIGDVEAERDFDLFLASPSPRGSWVEQEPKPAAA